MNGRRLLASLAALLVGWLGLLQPAADVAASVLIPTANTYISPSVVATHGNVYTERGPPSALGPNTNYDDTVSWLRGASTRSDASMSPAKPASYGQRTLEPVARMATTTRGPSRVACESSIDFDRPGVAANTPARFAVNSAGEATVSLRAGSASLEVTEHAALRMTQRGVSIDAAEATLAQRPFQYFHQNAWKTGYYDPASRIFLGSVNGRVTTVISRATPNYIENLKAAVP